MSIEMDEEERAEMQTGAMQMDGHPAAPVKSPANRPTLKTRWYTVPEAATLLGISEAAVRKRIASRSLTALKAGRGYRVLLAGDLLRKNGAGSGALVRSGTEETSLDSMAQLVRDLQQQSLALAGQIGYLQSRLAQAQEQLEIASTAEAQMPAQEADETAGMVSQEMHQVALDQIAELERIVAIYEQASAQTPAAPARRRWWPWRRS